MKPFVARMIQEHAELVSRIAKLDYYLDSEKSENDNVTELSDKRVQLNAMKQYEEALRSRLNSQNIYFIEGGYFEKVGQITGELEPDVKDLEESGKDSDDDIDKNE